jgi:hypothetical protein
MEREEMQGTRKITKWMGKNGQRCQVSAKSLVHQWSRGSVSSLLPHRAGGLMQLEHVGTCWNMLEHAQNIPKCNQNHKIRGKAKQARTGTAKDYQTSWTAGSRCIHGLRDGCTNKEWTKSRQLNAQEQSMLHFETQYDSIWWSEIKHDKTWYKTRLCLRTGDQEMEMQELHWAARVSEYVEAFSAWGHRMEEALREMVCSTCNMLCRLLQTRTNTNTNAVLRSFHNF